jgi:flagella basal body P-ring formation protein FlgA
MAVVGALAHPDEALGLEARTILYAGRPIRPDDVGTPAIVDRNSIVILVFRRGGLTITAEGRAMGRAGPGDQLRVTNLASRTTVTGIVQPDGRVTVGSLQDF